MIDTHICRHFADCSTGRERGMYYKGPRYATCTFDAVLWQYGLCFHPDYDPNFSKNNGHETVDIFEYKGDHTVVGRAIFTWDRRDSGRWEVYGFIVEGLTHASG